MNDIKDSFGLCRKDSVITGGEENITSFAKKNARFLQFCTPGHKGEMNSLDLTELDGGEIFPAGSIVKAEKLTAEHYGVKRARFLVNGASCGIKAAVLCARCDIIAPEFSHRSLFEGAELAGKRVICFSTGKENGLPKVPTPGDYLKAIEENPTAGAVFVTSPDYFGRTADIDGISTVCEKAGKILIADCAHGAHFASSDLFPEGGESKAHFSVLSAHKTLRSLTQSAIGVCNDERFFEGYDHALELLGTTSPSYLLLGSIYDGVAYEKEKCDGYRAIVSACNRLRNEVKCLNNDDLLRLVVDCGAYGKSGKGVFDLLVKENIMAETHYGDYCVFIVTLSDTVEKIERLTTALKKVLEV